jgi:hypothetical protein
LFQIALSVASGAVIYSRPLTNTPGNITTWRPAPSYTNYILGDDFTLGSSNTITDLSVWIAGTNVGTINPNEELSAIRLYLGADPGPLTLASSTYTFTYAGIFANPNLNINQPLFKITFSNLNFNATGGTLYDFAIEGVPLINDAAHQLALTSTLFPSAGDGADGVFLAFNGTTNTGPYNLFFTTPGSPTDPGPFYDINVELSYIPEPSTIVLTTLGFGALALFRRRRA